MYERMVTANGCLFKWNVNPVLVPKPGQVQPRLLFSYHFIYEDTSASNMEAASTIHDLLNISSHQCLFLADIRHGYWAFNVHPDDKYYLIFHILGISQVLLNRMPQGAKTSSFTFNELMNIILGLISVPHPEPLILYGKIAKDTVLLTFYMDNIFGAFKIYEK